MKCSVCGEVLTAREEIPALGHDLDDGKVTTGATETTTGEMTYTCLRESCGYTETEEIPVLELTIIASGECGAALTWKLTNDGTLTINGTGAMTNWFSPFDVPWYADQETVATVVIEDGVTSIGQEAFTFCTSLTEIIIPDGVTVIRAGTFDFCTSLESIVIPGMVHTIESTAFSGCISLTTVYYLGSEEDWQWIWKPTFDEEMPGDFSQMVIYFKMKRPTPGKIPT